MLIIITVYNHYMSVYGKDKTIEGCDNEIKFTKNKPTISPCQEAIGRVKHVTKMMYDGDFKFTLKVEKRFEFLLRDNQTNLVIEIMPVHRNLSTIQFPEVDDKVYVKGRWIFDKPMGWNELHPATEVKILKIEQQ